MFYKTTSPLYSPSLLKERDSNALLVVQLILTGGILEFPKRVNYSAFAELMT